MVHYKNNSLHLARKYAHRFVRGHLSTYIICLALIGKDYLDCNEGS